MTCIPFSVGLPCDFMVKTDKSKLFHKVSEGIDDSSMPPVSETLCIYDGNANYHCLRDIPGNFKKICRKIFNSMLKNGDAVFSTDMYKENSIKSMERRRRGMSDKLIINSATKKPEDWKRFLSNDQNKEQLTGLLKMEWRQNEYASDLYGQKIILICEGKGHLLTSEDGKITIAPEISSLESTQEETDTRIILYIDYAQNNGYRYVRVKSPDSDIFFILLHYADFFKNITILFDTGTGNKKRLINISEMARSLTPMFSTALLSLHAFTGCDTTSAFKGIGKLKPLKILENNNEYKKVFSELGNECTITQDTKDKLEAFTCAIYGKPRAKDINEARYQKLNEICSNKSLKAMKNVDLSSLPPCKKTLDKHINRVLYTVCILKKSHLQNPLIPDPEFYGWIKVDGILKPHWFDGEELPLQLKDVEVTDDSGSEDEDFDIDSDIMSDSDDD